MIISGSLRHLDVKGCDIAAEVIKLLNTLSSSLTVVVKSYDETAGITEALLYEGTNSKQLIVLVSESREDWCKLVSNIDLDIKPSRNEGFGMSSFLVISADLPVLISEHCRLGMVLNFVLFGNSHVVDSVKLQVWDKASQGKRPRTSLERSKATEGRLHRDV